MASEGKVGREGEKEGMERRGRGGGRRKGEGRSFHCFVNVCFLHQTTAHVYWCYTVATHPITPFTEKVECGGHVTFTLASLTAQAVPLLVGGARDRAPPLPPGRKCKERYLGSLVSSQ